MLVAVLLKAVLALGTVSLASELATAMWRQGLTATFVVAFASGLVGAIAERGRMVRCVGRGRNGSPVPASGDEPTRSEVAVTLGLRLGEVRPSARADGARLGASRPA